jgi:hypothetical protein
MNVDARISNSTPTTPVIVSVAYKVINPADNRTRTILSAAPMFVFIIISVFV